MGMVLINDVTKEDINAALIRLQKQGGVSQGGGTTTQQTIQNIQIQNSGSGSGSSSDVNAQLAELRNAINEQNRKIYNLEKRNTELEAIKDNLLDVQAYINSSAAGNITNITFNDATRQLLLATDVNTAMVSIPDGAYRYEARGPAFLLCKFTCNSGKETRLSFCMGGVHELDPTQAESLRVMSYAEVNITTQQYLPSGSSTWKSIVTVNGFCTENSDTPDTVKYNMGDIILIPSSNAQNENVTYSVYYVITNGSSTAYANKPFPIWWKIIVNETENFQIIDNWQGGFQDTDILWNSRYGFNDSFSHYSTYIDTTKSYSHFRNFAKVTETVNEVTVDNMQSVSSNAVAEQFAWEDITNQVTLTKNTSSGWYTAYNFTQTKIYKNRNFILLQTRLAMTSLLTGARKSLGFKLTSNRFTLSEKSIFSGASFYGDYIIGIIPYPSNNDVYIYARTPPNLEIPVGDSFYVGCIIPVEN